MSAALHNAKGPARIALLPSHGSTNPPKDTEMNKAIDITAPAEKKATDREVACAMRNLENSLRELMHMSDIACEAYDSLFSPSSRIGHDTNSSTYRVTKHEDDQMAFLINNVASRCSQIKDAFDAACEGRELV
jgi:hypothetical protein